MQDEIRSAIAEQEEHIKRSTSCQGIVDKAHAFRPSGTPGADGSTARAVLISRCIVCGVTETREDYAKSQ